MFNFNEMMIDKFVEVLHESYQQIYRSKEPQIPDIIEWTTRLALGNITKSDNLYHDVEHTVQVTLVGQAILKGKFISEGGVSPDDWLHFTIALLCHDIGYVRGVCRGDRTGICATGIGDNVINIDDDYTDSILTPYHVDRSKLFVRERFKTENLENIVDTARISNLIERTRFPIPDEPLYLITNDYPGLLRGADFIGQLGDPNYLRKVPALFYEFEENGVNAKTGYQSPGHMRRAFIKFYSDVVVPYVGETINYLNITQEGKQWVSTLYAHIHEMEGHLVEGTRPRA